MGMRTGPYYCSAVLRFSSRLKTIAIIILPDKFSLLADSFHPKHTNKLVMLIITSSLLKDLYYAFYEFLIHKLLLKKIVLKYFVSLT